MHKVPTWSGELSAYIQPVDSETPKSRRTALMLHTVTLYHQVYMVAGASDSVGLTVGPTVGPVSIL